MDALVVLFLQLGLEALILHKLQPIHLKLVQLVILWALWRVLTCWRPRAVTDGRWKDACHRMCLLLLRHLPLSCKLDIILIKNDLLNIMSRHLPHEQRLRIALLIPLNYLILEAQELQNLLEHRRRYTALL